MAAIQRGNFEIMRASTMDGWWVRRAGRPQDVRRMTESEAAAYGIFACAPEVAARVERSRSSVAHVRGLVMAAKPANMEEALARIPDPLTPEQARDAIETARLERWWSATDPATLEPRPGDGA